MSAPSILAPVDFSDASRTALQYAAVIAEHFGAELVVMTVTDPLLAEAAAMGTNPDRVKQDTLDALRRFLDANVERVPAGVSVVFEAPIGKPDAEILRAARAHRSDLIVISSHGLTGFRKMFFGSTTERVLRETAVPVLIVPGNQREPHGLAEAAAAVRRILVPVLLSDGDAAPLAIVRGLADVLNASTLLLHVVEPVRSALPHSERYLPGVERERRTRAETELARVAATLESGRVEALIAYGEPAEEIVKVAGDRDAGLIVITLMGSPLEGPRIGSVTYRVLSAAHCMVLALPRDFSRRGKKAARTQQSTAEKPALSLSKSTKSAVGTAVALKASDTRCHT
jgi:nucleotide-binding universal stress UspA family protein